MGKIWQEMGYIRWPLLFSFLAVVGLSLWSAMRLYRPGATADLRTKAWIDTVLFWGGFALIAGVLGTFVGFILAAQSVAQAGGVEISLVWYGMKVASPALRSGPSSWPSRHWRGSRFNCAGGFCSPGRSAELRNVRGRGRSRTGPRVSARVYTGVTGRPGSYA